MGDASPSGAATVAGRPVRCVLFDLGSTLWRRKDAATIAALDRLADARAVELVLPLIGDDWSGPPVHHEGRDDTLAELGARIRGAVQGEVRRRTATAPTQEPDFAEAARDGLRRLGVTAATTALGARVWESLRVRSVDSRRLFDDALPTLAVLRARGLLLGIVTNRGWGGRIFEEDLVRMGLREYIPQQATAVSADLGVRKPHPAIFEHALRGLGVGPEATAMVGDSLVADVGGASALGMVAVWKPRAELFQAARARGQAWNAGSHAGGADERAHLIASAWKREAGWDRERAWPAPDIVIEHLGELLPLCE